MGVLFSSDSEAAAAWGEENRPYSEVKERMAFIYALPVSGGSGFYLGRTRVGMGLWGPIRPNVAVPLVYLYLLETLSEWLLRRAVPVAVVHSHPRPPRGHTYGHHSREDLQLLRLPGIHAVFVVPYENREVLRRGREDRRPL